MPPAHPVDDISTAIQLNEGAGMTDMIDFRAQRTIEVRLSEVVGAMSHALDITEGQPTGHAMRTCMIGMRIAEDMPLSMDERSALFYALTLKDLGCSSNASKVSYLFGADDHTAKANLKTMNWTGLSGKMLYVFKNAAPGKPFMQRVRAFTRILRGADQKARELVELRCERGADIARQIDLPEMAAQAILSLDEHWDGSGHPRGLRGEAIPLLARIMCLAQTVEVFTTLNGKDSALDMAQQRAKKWFDPDLVRRLVATRGDAAFWQSLYAPDAAKKFARYEPEDRRLPATPDRLDRIAVGFSQVIDAKSPWTYRHSEGVATLAVGIARVLGFDQTELQLLNRAALLHDIGKLGVSNMILDKPGKLTPEERNEMRKHPKYTQQILQHVRGFSNIADVAAGHHERLDGQGYHQGVEAESLATAVRILTVADMYEALAAKRPYREDMTAEQVMDIINKQLNSGLDPKCVEALQVFLAESKFEPVKVAA
jgi:putative nucleotidyltransferase with HDIG domain